MTRDGEMDYEEPGAGLTQYHFKVANGEINEVRLKINKHLIQGFFDFRRLEVL